jgi:hypothetical protein
LLLLSAPFAFIVVVVVGTFCISCLCFIVQNINTINFASTESTFCRALFYLLIARTTTHRLISLLGSHYPLCPLSISFWMFWLWKPQPPLP